MTYLDLDVDRRLVGELVERAGTHVPDYADDVLAVVARTRQRPAWTFPARWLPVVDVRRATRWVLVAAVLGAAMLAGLLLWAGAHRPGPSPLAGNGRIVIGLGLEADRGFLDHAVWATIDDPLAEFARRAPMFVVDPETLEARRLPEAGYVIGFSPDGSRLAYLAPDNEGTLWLETCDADGGDLRPVNHDIIAGISDVSWSPDGRSLVVSHGSGGYPRLEIVSTDGSGSMRSLDPGMPADHAIWQPGGELILMRGYRTRTPGLYVMPADGSRGPTFVAEVDPVASVSWPEPEAAWSPDGQWVTYIRGGSDKPSTTPFTSTTVHVVRVDGSEHQVVLNTGVSTDPRWSPDGREILVRNVVDVGNGLDQLTLLAIALDGSGSRVLGRGELGSGADLEDVLVAHAWAPNGRLVFAGPVIMTAAAGEKGGSSQRPHPRWELIPAASSGFNTVALLTASGAEWSGNEVRISWQAVPP